MGVPISSSTLEIYRQDQEQQLHLNDTDAVLDLLGGVGPLKALKKEQLMEE